MKEPLKEPLKDWWKFAFFDALAIILFFLRRDDPYISESAVFLSLVYSLASCHDSNKEKASLSSQRDDLANQCNDLKRRVRDLETRLSRYEKYNPIRLMIRLGIISTLVTLALGLVTLIVLFLQEAP